MASASGRDVILTMMADVAELKRSSLAATRHLEEVGARFEEVGAKFDEVGAKFDEVGVRFEEVTGHFHLVTGHLDDLIKLGRDSAKRTDRIARPLSKLADLLGDHEDRITALEARQ